MNTHQPARVLRVLHLEDSELDHLLMLAHLQRGGIEAQSMRVESEREFRAALEDEWDVVLSDFSLPGFSGLTALEIIKASGKLLPFILVSGEIGEDVAVQAMRNGASDYLLKNNLARLVPAMLHAIDACDALKAKQRADLDLAQSKERLHELAQHLQTRIEQERTAIAREIHDDVGGSLAAVKFDLEWIIRNGHNPVITARAQQGLETLLHAIEASQRIMHNLRPAILEQGLVAALQWMTQRFERRTGITTIFRTSHESLEVSGSVALVAYRMAQEALTNITKHAHATQVQVDLALAGGVLSLEVSDNGRGLSQDDLAKAKSFGIRGLHERAGTVGGWMDMSSGAGGTTLILSIPLDFTGSDDEEPQDEEPVTGAGSLDDPTSWGGE